MWKPDPLVKPQPIQTESEPLVEAVPLSEEDFERFRRFIHDRAGISLTPHKRQMVSSRLQRRLRHLGLRSFHAYLEYVSEPSQDRERQHLIDLLTTNETYFYREPAHFEFLLKDILPAYRGSPMRVWSAACSSGEEVYTLAMVLAEGLGMGDWRILGSDISSRMVEAARQGLYPLERAKRLPTDWLGKYCLKGVRSQAGNLLIDPRLKARVQLEQRNLKRPPADGALFDVVFLRNVLIYFDIPTKQQVIDGLTRAIQPGGYLFISHVESLHSLKTKLEMVRPSVFRKPLD
ncbi:CheR family methyltransferase [Thiocystis violascens]|uniref:Chemotaxis protein methyltransferase n=1 Tax=Thiocystis violascens (strain ATCC 17096 / DSM 198 / 6111) TaxID=765911 RepID=I3Y5W9_THIV6|nr:CheR family methyltransferase [Thiocystis violascens]AFL72387.1 methylase of chemotaxis methyl-accepting protein [Thiocystis violascens DSM 198]